MTIDEIKGVTEEEINLEILGILNEEKEINILYSFYLYTIRKSNWTKLKF